MMILVIPTLRDHFQVPFTHTSPSWHSKLITFFNSLLCRESVGNNSWMSFCWRGDPAVACLFYLSPYDEELLFDSSAIQTCQHLRLRKCRHSVNHWYVYMLFVFPDSSLLCIQCQHDCLWIQYDISQINFTKWTPRLEPVPYITTRLPLLSFQTTYTLPSLYHHNCHIRPSALLYISGSRHFFFAGNTQP